MLLPGKKRLTKLEIAMAVGMVFVLLALCWAAISLTPAP